MEELVEQGKFREDLYYRLKVFTINIPPLRERKNDIPVLVIHLLKKINKELHKEVSKIPTEVMEMIQNYEWIGNVRELENTLMQAVVLAKGEVLEKENLLLRHKSNGNGNGNGKYNPQNLSLEEVEKVHIRHVLDKVNWDKKEAAALLQISRQTLYNKIKAYSLDKSV